MMEQIPQEVIEQLKARPMDFAGVVARLAGVELGSGATSLEELEKMRNIRDMVIDQTNIGNDQLGEVVE